MRLPSLSLLLLVPALMLAACGGGGTSEEDKIKDVINEVSTGTNPADCTQLATKTFLEQGEFAKGQDAVAACKKDQADTANDPDSVETSNVSVDGDAAKASIAFSGGAFDGQNLDVSLIKDSDQWKLDKIEDIPGFDVEKFAAATEASAQEGPDPATPEEAKCIGDQLRSTDATELKQIVLSGDPRQLVALLGSC